MKKLLLALAVSMTAVSGFAGNPEILFGPDDNGIPSTLTYDATQANKRAIKTTAPSKAPTSIVGLKFMALYNNKTNDANNGFYIEKDSTAKNVLLLKRFARGYDVKAIYDPETGVISIPTGVVVNHTEANGDYTMYGLNAQAGTYNSNPIEGRFDEDGNLFFNQGVYVQYESNGTKYYIVWMQDIVAQPANAMATLTNATSNVTAKLPLLVRKSAPDSITMVGMSSYAYNYYTKMPLQLDSANLQVKQGWLTEIVDYISNYGNYYLGGTNAAGNIVALTLKADTTASSTKLNAPTLWYVYNKSGNSYSGYKFAPADFEIDYNIFTAPVEKEEEFDAEPIIDGVHYLITPLTKSAEVTGCDDAVTKLTIPAKITQGSKEYAVNSIAAKAFYQKTKISSVSIAATSVGSNAFYGCTGITSLTLEDGVNYVTSAAFRGCTKIKTLALPKTLMAVGDEAFYGCSSITTLTLNDGLSSIGASAFRNLSKLTKIEIPNSVASIGSYAFYGCSVAASANVPEMVRSIEANTFGACTGLKTIEIAEGVNYIGSNAFSGCTKLVDVKMPSTMKTIDEGAFSSCKGLKTIIMPAALKSIGKYAFSSCTGLDSISFTSKGLETLGLGAFDNCTSMTYIQIPSTVKEIGSMAFSGCYSLEMVRYMAEDPISGNSDIFDSSTCSYAKLMVYPTALEKIRQIQPWCQFTTIEADFTKVEGIESDCDEITEIYTISGLKVNSSYDLLPQGIYMIRKGTKTQKVIKN